ncbi:MAG: MarR family transcriptional regulator [Candidatus Hermodarchaeota archaeon]
MADSEQKSIDEDLLAIKNELIHFFEDMLAARGANRRLGDLYGHFLFTDNQLKQKELAEELDRNQSTISRDLKYLEQIGLIKKRRESNSREWLYSTSSESFIELITNRVLIASRSLQRGLVTLELLKKRWKKLEDAVKSSKRGKRLREILDAYIIYLEIMIEELEITTKKLRIRFEEIKA